MQSSVQNIQIKYFAFFIFKLVFAVKIHFIKENVKLETITDSFKLPNKLIHVFIIKKGNVKVLIFCEDSENL